jgi:hypothetical protein
MVKPKIPRHEPGYAENESGDTHQRDLPADAITHTCEKLK